MSAGKQEEKTGKGVLTPVRPGTQPEENGWERVSVGELGRRVSVAELAIDAGGDDDAAVRRGDPASAPADPQSAGISGEKPQSEPRSGDPLDSDPLDSDPVGEAKPLKLLPPAQGEIAGKVGLKAALDTVFDKITPAPPGRAKQMPLPIVVEPEGVRDGEDQAVARRGPGRPKGSRGRRTDEWIAYLLHDRRPPLLVLAETYSRPVEQLAHELQCSKLDAFKLQLFAADKLTPFVHQKLPAEVQVDERGVVRLVIEGGLPGGGRVPGSGEAAGEGKGVREEAGGVVVLKGQVIDDSGEDGGNE